VEYSASYYQGFVGKKVVEVLDTTEGDEGLKLWFDDGSFLEIYFSGNEGVIATGVSLLKRFLLGK
jgi:hypothetical protein